MGSIYLIRHGQASFGADDYDVLSPKDALQATLDTFDKSQPANSHTHLQLLKAPQLITFR